MSHTKIINPQIAEIKANNEFLCSLELPEIQIYLTYQGTDKVIYHAFKDGAILFTGNDFKPAPNNNIDSIQSCVDLLGFLTCQPGDTDSEYFDKYTATQMAWAKSYECEQLKCLLMDFEDNKSEYHDDAVINLTQYFNLVTQQTNKYQLAAREGREYSSDSGWEFADHDYKTSEYFETKESAMAAKDAFVTSLNVTKDDVYELNLITLTWDEDEDIENDEPNIIDETLNAIDLSDKITDYKYVAYQYFGQYMIAQGKWTVDYAPSYYYTLNQLFKVCEYSSFNYHPLEVFKTKADAIEAMKDKYIVSSVIKELESED